jgi:hypothetical protein
MPEIHRLKDDNTIAWGRRLNGKNTGPSLCDAPNYRADYDGNDRTENITTNRRKLWFGPPRRPSDLVWEVVALRRRQETN